MDALGRIVDHDNFLVIKDAAHEVERVINGGRAVIGSES